MNFIKKSCGYTLIIILMLASLAITVFASGSKTLIFGTDPEPNPNAYRPYLEWYNSKTAGIDRMQIIKVYLNAGETILFGSSVTSSSYSQSGEILLRTPLGGTTIFNVVSNGEGHIANKTEEKNGGYYIENEKIKINSDNANTDCYIPIKHLAEVTGIYELEFYSPTYDSRGNPTPIKATADWVANTQATVAAWNVTVLKPDASTDYKPVTGRVFCNYLCLNMGHNFVNYSDKNGGLYSVVYVLTRDGYVYKTDFNGLDPYGFVFFANNRGLINIDNNTSLYHSARNTVANNAMESLQIKLDSGDVIDVQFHNPSLPDTETDFTYKIFFEEPAEDLPTSIKPTPYVPGEVTNFYFEGYQKDEGYAGQGGWFYFTVANASSYQIVMEIDAYTDANGNNRAGSTLYLSSACTNGVNRVFWDGKDANGYVVPAGTYGEDTSKIQVSLQVKAGEYHFPMLDVEHNPKGIKIELISTLYNTDGTPYVWIDKVKETTTIYYDNTYIFTQSMTTKLSALEGVSSKNGAADFKYEQGLNVGSDVKGGDYAAIDIWTYSVGDNTQTSTTLEKFVLKDPDTATDAEKEKASVKGLVFYDTNRNGAYSYIDADYPLSGIAVELWNAAGTEKLDTTTDIHGYYTFTDENFLKKDQSYSIRVILPHEAAVNTTTVNWVKSADNKYLSLTAATVTLQTGVNNIADAGIFYELADLEIEVTKVWADPDTSDPSRPSEVKVVLIGSNTNGVELIRNEVTLSQSTGWSYKFTSLSKFAPDGTTELTYSIEEVPVEGYVSTMASYVDDGGKKTTYILTNTLKKLTIVKELDEVTIKDEYFIFDIKADNSSGTIAEFSAVVTVAAGATTGEITVIKLPNATYTVTERATNISYELLDDGDKTLVTKNGTKLPGAFNYDFRRLTTDVTDAGEYIFTFTNNRNTSYWLYSSNRVTNIMTQLGGTATT